MTTHSLSSMMALPVLAFGLWFAPLSAEGQTSVPAASAESLSRTTDGQPDVQGFWEAAIGGTYSLVDPRRGGGRLDELLQAQKGVQHVTKPSRIVDPPNGQIPYLPWAAAKQKDILEHMDEATQPQYIDPQARCLPDGVPRAMFWSPSQVLHRIG